MNEEVERSMKRIFTNLGLWQIFFSLLLVISIMFASTYFVYRSSISGIYEKVSENNTLSVKSIVQSFDSSFRTVDNVIHAIHNLPPYDNLDTADGRLDMAKVFTMVENVGSLISTIDFIEEAVIFYEGADLAITSRGTSGFSYFFNNKYKHEIYNANYWKNYSRTKHAFQLFPSDDFRIITETNQERSKKLLVAVGGNKVQMSQKNVMIFIDVAALLKHVNQKSMIPGASLILLDQNRNIILSTDGTWDLVEVLNDVYFNPDRSASLTREDYEYNFYKSEYNGFIYIDKVPYQFQNLNPVAEANYRIMLSAIVCAVVLSVFLSVYLYRPVINILRQLGGGHSKGNDFRKIHSGIVKLQLENESYRKQVEFADSELRRGVFLQALDESQHAREHDVQMQAYYPDFFKDKYFVMVLIQAGPKANDKPSIPVEAAADILQEGLRRESWNTNVFHASRSHYLAVIGLEQPGGREKLLKRLGAFLTRAEKEELADFSLWACISKLYNSEIENCKRAYQDVMNGNVYRNVNDPGKVLAADEIRYVWSFHFPFEKMEKLSNYLLSGKLPEAVQIIKETMEENIERNIHHHQLVHLAKTMFFYMLRHAGGSSSTNRELFQLEAGFMRKIDRAAGCQEIEESLIEAAKHLANPLKREHRSKLNAAFIAQYIELHYMENLYLDHISEVTETTPKYFSNYFKKTFGVSYVEYLNKVRLSHARELLRDTNLSVSEIGEKIGYLNSSTFTTTFRKYLGISPSDYRKQNAG